MVTIEYCRLNVKDTDLAKFLQPRLAKKGIRNLALEFTPGAIRVAAEYPFNRWGLGEIAAKVTLALTNFDPATQVIELCIKDFDIKEAGQAGALGKLLGMGVEMAKRVAGTDLVRKILEFLRGRLSFLDVDAPGLKLRIRVHTIAELVSPYVNNLNPDEISIENGRLVLVQREKQEQAS